MEYIQEIISVGFMSLYTFACYDRYKLKKKIKALSKQSQEAPAARPAGSRRGRGAQ